MTRSSPLVDPTGNTDEGWDADAGDAPPPPSEEGVDLDDVPVEGPKKRSFGFFGRRKAEEPAKVNDPEEEMEGVDQDGAAEAEEQAALAGEPMKRSFGFFGRRKAEEPGGDGRRPGG